MDTIAVVVADEQWLAQLTECCNASWHAAKQHDGALFSQPPPIDECPICMLPLKMNRLERAYYPCCGKEICIGCVYALGHNRRKCVFCRTPMNTSNRELIKQFESRVEAGDALATFCLGCLYDGGRRGLRRDRDKAVKLWLRAAVLGNAGASSMIGYACCYGSGVEVDHEKALGCWKLAAIRGDAGSRYILGTNEVCLRNYDRALNHFVISAVAGHDESLTAIQMFQKTSSRRLCVLTTKPKKRRRATRGKQPLRSCGAARRQLTHPLFPDCECSDSTHTQPAMTLPPKPQRRPRPRSGSDVLRDCGSLSVRNLDTDYQAEKKRGQRMRCMRVVGIIVKQGLLTQRVVTLCCM